MDSHPQPHPRQAVDPRWKGAGPAAQRLSQCACQGSRRGDTHCPACCDPVWRASCCMDVGPGRGPALSWLQVQFLSACELAAVEAPERPRWGNQCPTLGSCVPPLEVRGRRQAARDVELPWRPRAGRAARSSPDAATVASLILLSVTHVKAGGHSLSPTLSRGALDIWGPVSLLSHTRLAAR